MQRTDSMEKTLKLGKIELKAGGEVGDKGWDGFDVSIDMSLSKLEIVKDKEAWHAAVHGVTKSQTWLHNQTRDYLIGIQDKTQICCKDL